MTRAFTELHLAALWHWAVGARRARVSTLAGAAAARPADPAAVLGSTWAALSARERAAVTDPVRLLARHGRQTDGTTCGPAVLLMLAAAGDPALALWLATGRLPEGPRPPELSDAPLAHLTALADAPPAARFAALQRVVKHRASRRADLGVLPWPGRFGTPPWSAAAAARFPGVSFEHAPVDDRDHAHASGLLAAVVDAVGSGVPVPLYSGGDVGHGWDTAVPRHLVLALGVPETGVLEVWEPGAGAVVRLTHDQLLSGGRHPGLGGWSRWVWTLVPRLDPDAGAGARRRAGRR